MIIAHRGFGRNLIQDFKQALQQTKAIEFDLRLTKDKKIIIYHDSNFYGVTGHNRAVRKMTYKEIKQIPYFIEHPSELPPLFVSDFIPIAKDFELIDIEIKPNHYKWIDFLFYQRAFNLLRRKTKAEIIVSSFNLKVMNWATSKLSRKKFKIGYIFFNVFTLNEVIKDRADYLMPRWELLLSHRHQDWFRAQTKKLFPWTLKEQDDLEKIKALYPDKKIEGWIADKLLIE